MDTSFFSTIYQEALRAWPNRWLGFFTALILASGVALVVIALPDQYASTARVFINTEVVLKPLLKDLTIEEEGEARLADLRLFQTTLLSDTAIDALVATEGVGFDASSPAARSAAASSVRRGVTIVEEQDNLFTIKSMDSNPVRARNVVHGLLSFFIETYITRARSDLEAAAEFLDKQIEDYKQKLLAMEAEMNAFRLQNAEVIGGEPTFQTRLSVARTAVRDAQLQRQMAVELRDRIRAEVDRNQKTQPGSSSALLATDQTFPALIDRISALQTQLNQLLLVYTEKHPDVVATRREIAVLTEQFGLSDAIASATKPFTVLPGQVPPGQAVQPAIQPVTPPAPGAVAEPVATPAASPTGKQPLSAIQMRLLQANFAVLDADRKLNAALAGLKVLDQYSSSAPAAEAAYDKMNRDYTAMKENYDQLVRRRETARISAAAIQPSGSEYYRLVETPSVSESPDGPDRRTYLLAGAAICLALGTALAYAIGLMRGTFVSAAEAERTLGLPVIARLSNSGGVLGSLSQSAEVLTLAAGVAGIFVGAYVISAATELLGPIRAEIYRLLETDIGSLFSRLL